MALCIHESLYTECDYGGLRMDKNISLYISGHRFEAGFPGLTTSRRAEARRSGARFSGLDVSDPE